LVPKNWYFGGTEADANRAAAKVADRWAFIVKNWGHLYQNTLGLTDSAFANEPHWQPMLERSEPTDSEIKAFQAQKPTADEIAEAHADVRLNGVFGSYKLELARRVADGDKSNTTAWTDEKNIRCALRHFNTDMRMDALTDDDIRNAKSAILAKASRRTADNYLSALKTMLTWFYGSAYGKWHERFPNYDDAFLVKNANNLDIRIPTAADAKLIVTNATGLARLMSLLSLNCGMYAADIGRLTLDELNLVDGYIFWDREKQPRNPFKVRHDLWPETLAVVRQHVQRSGSVHRYHTDYRGHQPTQVDCSTLAFVDGQGNPLYRVRENGKAYDKFARPWQLLNAALIKGKKISVGCQFHSLRKATNQVLIDLLQSKVDGDDRGQIIAIGEISAMYLGHKSAELIRLYETRGVNGYGRMNKYLREVGHTYRTAGVFE
jgi:integrase